ncbi:MAG: tail fiber domain-containing protein [Cytophagales bacterium]|nr:tail fiber domain-containing protein [Cytophagales bacterium]
MKTKKLLLSLLLSGLCLATAQAQEFWFPNAPKNSNTTVVRPGRTGIGIPTASFNAFNTSTGRYTVANRVGFLVQGSNFTDVFNIGHLLTGDYGEEKVGDVWTAIGGPGNPNIAGLPLYGTRHQFDRYSVNLALTDRNIITGASGTSGIRDAILFWDASPADNSRMYIGQTLGQGRIRPDIVISPRGNVGIGTDSPGGKLQVQGGDIRLDAGGAALRFGSSATISEMNGDLVFTADALPRASLSSDGFETGGVRISPSSSASRIIGDGALDLSINTPAGVATAIRIRDWTPRIVPPINIDGDDIDIFLDIGSRLLPDTDASIPVDLGASFAPWDDVFADNFVNTSDLRAKQKVQSLDYGLEQINALNPVSYQWKDREEQGTHVGLIAQEVMEVIPEVIYDPAKNMEYDEEGKAIPTDPGARYGIRYHELIPVMIKAMQEMSQAMEKQETKIQEQESRIEEQDKIIASLLGENTRTVDEGMGKSIGSPALELFQNTPNPFDQSTTIRYSLPEGTQKAELFVYDINGQQVRSMELTEAGEGAMTLTAGELGAGIYFYTLYADGEVSQTRKMILTE